MAMKYQGVQAMGERVSAGQRLGKGRMENL